MADLGGFYGGWQILGKAMVGQHWQHWQILKRAMLTVEKLSKSFHGPADLVEPSEPEQTESHNTSWKIQDRSNVSCVFY